MADLSRRYEKGRSEEAEKHSDQRLHVCRLFDPRNVCKWAGAAALPFRHETHKWTFRPPCSLPSFGHSFMLSDPLAGSDVSRTRIGEKCDISAAHRRRDEQRALSNADVSDRTSDLIGRLGAVSLTRTALHTMHVGL